MQEIFSIVAITTIIVLGVKIITSEGMILENLGKYLELNHGRNKILEPLGYCAWCMPSIYTLVVGYPLAYMIGILNEVGVLKLIAMFPICVCASSFLSGVLWIICETLISKKLLIDNKQRYYYFMIKNMKDEYNKKKHG